MYTSLFLAKLIGPIFVIVGTGLLLNGDRYRAVVDEVMSSHTLLYIFGAIALTGGLAIVLTHNIWVWDWPVIITIVGWLMIVRGSFRIVFPQQVEDLARKMVAGWPEVLLISGVLVITIGAFLCWKGFA